MSDPLLHSLAQSTLLYIEDDAATREELAFLEVLYLNFFFSQPMVKKGMNFFAPKDPISSSPIFKCPF